MEFPRFVYKRGTGKKVDDSGLFTAESALVKTPEDLEALGWDFCASPVDAAPVANPKQEEKPKKGK